MDYRLSAALTFTLPSLRHPCYNWVQRLRSMLILFRVVAHDPSKVSQFLYFADCWMPLLIRNLALLYGGHEHHLKNDAHYFQCLSGLESRGIIMHERNPYHSIHTLTTDYHSPVMGTEHIWNDGINTKDPLMICHIKSPTSEHSWSRHDSLADGKVTLP